MNVASESLISVIITSYNQVRTLEVLLASLERQTDLSFEVMIADDGSSDGTEKLCKEKRRFPLQFVSQEDCGYRKSRILNRAIRHTQSDYLIFLDADLVLERHFVEDHRRLRQPGHFVCGRRVDLGPKLSQNLSVNDIAQGKFDHLSWDLIWSGFKKDSSAVKRAIRISSPWLRRVLGYDQPIDLLGSNFSVWKSDILAVNGFNEALEAYWGEDGDLFIRLRNFGLKAIGAKGVCVQYHIFHPRRTPNPTQVELYRKLLDDRNYKWASQGYRESGTL